jgi:hypothetical protein
MEPASSVLLSPVIKLAVEKVGERSKAAADERRDRVDEVLDLLDSAMLLISALEAEVDSIVVGVLAMGDEPEDGPAIAARIRVLRSLRTRRDGSVRRSGATSSVHMDPYSAHHNFQNRRCAPETLFDVRTSTTCREAESCNCQGDCVAGEED